MLICLISPQSKPWSEPGVSQMELQEGIILKSAKLSVIVWNEFIHERQDPAIWSIYPDGLHSVIANALKRTIGINSRAAALDVTTATLDQPDHGLSEARLEACDVLIWWGHLAHDEVSDEVVDRIHRRVLEGMGVIVLHSGYSSKIFHRLLGTNCSLKWRCSDEKERLWVVEPSHPIAAGLGELFELPVEAMHGENFDIVQPDSTVFISGFEGGEVFRSGCCWERGYGRLFYFRPGHISYPTFHNHNVQRVLANAVQWAAPRFKFFDMDIGDSDTDSVEKNGLLSSVHGEKCWKSSPAPSLSSKAITDTKPAVAKTQRKDIPVRHSESKPLFSTLINHLNQRDLKQKPHKNIRGRSQPELVTIV